MNKIDNLTEIFDEHLHYEIAMLVNTFRKLEEGIPDDVTRNAFIESFCIHARILIDFFNGKKGVPADSFVEAAYVPFRNGAIKGSLITKLNTQIAHLTHNRTKDGTKKIDDVARRELFSALTSEAKNFASHLKKEYRSGWKLDGVL